MDPTGATPPLAVPTSVTTGTPPSPAAVPFPAAAASAPPSTLQLAWPSSAQWATVGLLVLATVLLAVRACGLTRWGTRPAELQRGTGFAYRVDLNRARRAELLQLPGVGDGLAKRIEQYRAEHGGFRRVEDLLKVGGVGPATLERLRPWVVVQVDEPEEAEAPPIIAAEMPEPAPVPRQPKSAGKKEAVLKGSRIDLNRASPAELQRLPGIGPKLSQRIVEERKRQAFRSVDDLRRVAGIGAKTLERLRPYVSAGAEPVGVARAE